VTCIGDLDGGSEIDYRLSPAEEEQDAAVENIIRARTPKHVAMSIPGHKSRSIFDRYNIISNADLKSATGRLITFYENQREAIEEKSKSLENRAMVKVTVKAKRDE
jgi:hypothetical protein